ncbi:ABC transporter permease [Marivirga sp.]|uniref:ABC transporter permease n=1 Tax=Marivirga sp. TaxID=2018662 RepID=UPI002D7EA7AD|nr:ABC transporter permease subunit [Marivirga sp.]HET8858392.1 ABC transporter permease subunit [Marivirga sp.]
MPISLRPFFLSAMVLLILFPFIYLIWLSLSADWSFPSVLPNYFGLKNWKALLISETGLLWSFFQSVIISISVGLTSTLIGFVISRNIAYHPRKNTLTLLSYFPYIISPVVFGACLSYFFLKMGIFGQMTGVIIAQFMISFPYALIFFNSFWGEKTKNMEALVSTLGGNRFYSFTKVLLPLAKGMLLVCFFQTFLISWFEYGLTSVIGVGKVQTLTIKVFLFIRESNYFYGALSCCLLILPPLVLMYINKKYVFNKLT